MRFLSLSAAAVLAVACIGTSLHAQRADDQIDPRSMALLVQGRAQAAAGNLDAANDTLEAALAVDPRNRGAIDALGNVALSQNLPGKAFRYYREALSLEPNDAEALKGQGVAMVQKGAVELAKGNLTRLQTLCKQSNCPDVAALSAAIAKGPPAPEAAQVVPAKVPAAN